MIANEKRVAEHKIEIQLELDKQAEITAIKQVYTSICLYIYLHIHPMFSRHIFDKFSFDYSSRTHTLSVYVYMCFMS